MFAMRPNKAFAPPPEALSAALILASQAVIALVCYAFTLNLPFFWDDVPQNAWLDRTSLPAIWTSTVTGLNYFRPIPFTVWKVFSFLQGHDDPIVFHGVNVVLHILNAWLLGLMVYRVAARRKTLTGIAAATLFTLFPFSFQAIAPVNSVMHPMHASFILAAVLLYLIYRSSGRQWLKTVSVILAGAAVFAHENGIVACALITWTALCVSDRRPLKSIALDTLPYWLAAFAVFLLWRAVPRPVDPLPISSALTQFESRLQNSALFLQGFAFPFTAFARPAKSLLATGNDLTIIGVVGLTAAILWLAVFGWNRRMVWAAGWFVIASLPTVVLLDFNYVIESPRLLYLASAGAAAFWAMPIGIDVREKIANRVLMAAGLLLVVGAAVWGFVYIQRRADLYRLLGQSVAQLHDALSFTDCDNHRAQSVVLNAPEWFFVREPEYLIGHDGIKAISEGGGWSDLLTANYHQRADVAGVVLPDIQAANAPFKPFGEAHTQDSLQPILRAARNVVVNMSDPSGARLIDAGCLVASSQGRPSDYAARFDERLALVNASIALDASNPRRATLALDWHAMSANPEDVTVFVHVVDASGKLVTQADGYPIGGSSPMRTWQIGDVWRDVRLIHFKDLPAGEYTVLVGVYRTGDGTRLPSIGATGGRMPDDAFTAARLHMP